MCRLQPSLAMLLLPASHFMINFGSLVGNLHIYNFVLTGQGDKIDTKSLSKLWNFLLSHRNMKQEWGKSTSRASLVSTYQMHGKTGFTLSTISLIDRLMSAFRKIIIQNTRIFEGKHHL